jgi:hypothetical protein
MFNGGSMNKIFILLSFLIVSSMVFISCFQDDCMNATGYNNCIVLDDCNNNSDCSENQFCSLYDGKCHENPCVHENITCGLGECVINETGGYSCECNEGATISELNTCFPACSSDSDCEEFAKDNEEWSRNIYCDVEKGYCVFNRPNK